MGDPRTLELLRQAVAVAEAQQAAASATVRELWEPWFKWARKHRPNFKLVRSHARGLLETSFEHEGAAVTFADLQWSALTKRHWEAWRKAVRKLDGGEMAPGTRNSHLTTLQAMFRWHVEAGALPHNPARGFGRESEAEQQRQGWFTPDLQERFLAHALPLLRRMMLVSIRCGGLRHSEVSRLRKDEVDWESREIIIRAGREKTRVAKIVLITDDAWEILCRQRDSSESDYLFPNPRDPQGRPVPERTVQGWVTRAAKVSGVELLGEKPIMHATRHTFYMQNLSKPEAPPLNWLMDQAGHKSIAVAGRYARLRGGEAKEKMRSMMNAEMPRKPPKQHTSAHSIPQKSRDSSGKP